MLTYLLVPFSDRQEVRPAAASVAERVRAVRGAVPAQVHPEGAADGRRRARAARLARGDPLRPRLPQRAPQRPVYQGLFPSIGMALSAMAHKFFM